ncbi:MAG: hypothetical protein PHE51_05500 [Eubacteriales bacterium]|nr:hypothetical protein [Eubacteriales bacterium]
MLFNRSVTIYKQSMSSDGISWGKSTYEKAYIHRTDGINKTDDMDIGSNKLIARVSSQIPICNVGDRIIEGNPPSPLPPENCYTITAVTENFIGSKDMWHIKIFAE